MKLWQRRLLGILTLGGGAVGVTVTLQQILLGNGLWNCLLFLAAALVFSCGIASGLFLIEGRPGAERINRRYWLIQVPIFNSPLLGGFIWCGAKVSITIGIWPMSLNWHAGLGGAFQFNLLQRQEPFVIGVNVFALAMAIWLARMIATASTREKPDEVTGS